MKIAFLKKISTREGTHLYFHRSPPSTMECPHSPRISRSLKIFLSYKTLKGFLVNRKAGWDTHGLPVELKVEKKLDY